MDSTDSASHSAEIKRNNGQHFPPFVCYSPLLNIREEITDNAIENPVCFADSESFMAANTRYENIQLLVLPPQFLQMQNKYSCPADIGLTWSSRGGWAHTTGGYD